MVIGVGFAIFLLIMVLIAVDRGNKKKRNPGNGTGNTKKESSQIDAPATMEDKQ